MRSHTYHNASKSSHGRMICGACNKPIEEGEYRVRETDDRFIAHHRSCMPSDPEWAKRDAIFADQRAHYAAFVRACRDFRDLWGITDLDDYIEG